MTDHSNSLTWILFPLQSCDPAAYPRNPLLQTWIKATNLPVPSQPPASRPEITQCHLYHPQVITIFMAWISTSIWKVPAPAARSSRRLREHLGSRGSRPHRTMGGVQAWKRPRHDGFFADFLGSSTGFRLMPSPPCVDVPEPNVQALNKNWTTYRFGDSLCTWTSTP